MKHSPPLARALLAVIFIFLLSGHASGEDRALLIGAGRYASAKWDLPSVEENLRIFQKSLIEDVGVPPANISIVVDAAVTRTGVMRALKVIARQAKSGDRLFLYFTGHATKVLMGGAPVRAFFTWDTIENDDGAGFECESLLTDVDLKRWTKPLKEKGVLVAVIREACYSGGGYSQDISTFAPGRPPSRQMVGQIELSACDVGQAAWTLAGAQPPRALFTAELVEVLASDEQVISFQTLAESVQTRVSRQQSGQKPVLDCDGTVDPANIILVDRTLVDLVVEVNDAVTGQPLREVKIVVTIPGEDKRWSGIGSRARLNGVPRRLVLYPWIEMNGYVPESKRIEIAPKERVISIRVDLDPELAVVTGKLEIDGPGSLAGIRVAYESGAEPVDARHVDSEVRPRGDGTFRLKVPPRGACRILAVKGAETLVAVDIEGGRKLDPARFFNTTSGKWAGRSYDAGVITLKAERPAPELSEAERVFEEYLTGAEDAEERGDLETSLRFYRLALEAAGMIADPPRRKDLTRRALEAVEKIEAGLVSNRYEVLVKSGKEALQSGDLEKARLLADEALAINPEGVMAKILLKDAGSRMAGKGAKDQKRAAAVPGFTFLGKQSFLCRGKSTSVEVYSHDRTGLEFVLIPEGSIYNYWQQKTVTVESFLMCRTECTQAAWDKVGGNDDRHWRGENLPIERVSWDGCTEWCRKAGLRLPTLIEWEYAGRGGAPLYLNYYFGDSESDLVYNAWYGGNSGMRTHRVAQKRPNAFGLYDVHGNVYEWCQDAKRSGPPSVRINKGGCYYTYAECSFYFYRGAFLESWSQDLGFRPAASLP